MTNKEIATKIREMEEKVRDNKKLSVLIIDFLASKIDVELFNLTHDDPPKDPLLKDVKDYIHMLEVRKGYYGQADCEFKRGALHELDLIIKELKSVVIIGH